MANVHEELLDGHRPTAEPKTLEFPCRMNAERLRELLYHIGSSLKLNLEWWLQTYERGSGYREVKLEYANIHLPLKGVLVFEGYKGKTTVNDHFDGIQFTNYRSRGSVNMSDRPYEFEEARKTIDEVCKAVQTFFGASIKPTIH